jgi:hypothetical protein
MKWTYAAYGFLVIALVFAGLMVFLRFAETQPDGLPGQDIPSAGGGSSSAEPGKLVIAYAGDLMGDLDPCG